MVNVALVAHPPCSAEKASLTASSAARGWRSTFGGIRLRRRDGVQQPGKKKNS